MKQKKSLFIILIAVVIIVIYFLLQSKQEKANMLLINGIIYTLDAKNTITQAIAIRENTIVGVGSNDDITKSFSSDTVIDLQGKTVFPGLIDGHCHILGEGGRLQTIDLVGTTSPEQIADLVSKRVEESKPEQWIIGRGWDQNDWSVKEFPDHTILDKVAPYNPVLLRRVDGHAIWINQKALQIAGINSGIPEPNGGKILKDKKGNPTGVFVDNAMDLIDKVVPSLSDEEVEQRLKIALEECARLGLTEVHDMGVDLQTIRAYKRLIDRGECPIRVYAAIGDLGETWKHFLQSGTENGYGNGMLTIRSVKLYVDGALGSRGAALIDEYSDDPGNRGLTIMSESQMDSICQQALEKGFQVCTHAIGDRGNHITLNVYERVLRNLSKEKPTPRWRIEHAQVLQPTDIIRFKQLDVLPSMQPTHATSDMYWAETRLGPERVKGAYAWRSILKTGVQIISGSDFPVEYVNPLFGIYAAITRKDREGNPPEGWYSDQNMTRNEAVRSFTEWAAYGAFEESKKGTIEIGKWADLTILSKDIMKISPIEILNTDVKMILVNGKIVSQKGGINQ